MDIYHILRGEVSQSYPTYEKFLRSKCDNSDSKSNIKTFAISYFLYLSELKNLK